MEINEMKIKSCKLRAADEFRAKGDVRHYLNGIHINKDFVQATNGNVAIQMNSEVKTRLDVIVRFKGKIPKSAYTTKLEFSKGKNIAYHYDNMDELISVQIFSIEEGKFPDFKRVIPDEFKIENAHPTIAAEYMAVTHKAFGNQRARVAMKVVHCDSNEKAVVYEVKSPSLHECGKPLVVIMPMRDYE